MLEHDPVMELRVLLATRMALPHSSRSTAATSFTFQLF